jgi:hypothetical protein
MASKPKAQAKPDPATIASSPGTNAKKQQELENRRKKGFYSGFKNITPTGSSTGGGNQTTG